jgi:hypothetical protein
MLCAEKFVNPEGREPQASAGSVDSQSIKTTEKRGRYTASTTDNSRRGSNSAPVSLRKRHLVVDTLGLLMGVAVTEANLQDRLGGASVLMEESCSCEQLQLI